MVLGGVIDIIQDEEELERLRQNLLLGSGDGQDNDGREGGGIVADAMEFAERTGIFGAATDYALGESDINPINMLMNNENLEVSEEQPEFLRIGGIMGLSIPTDILSEEGGVWGLLSGDPGQDEEREAGSIFSQFSPLLEDFRERFLPQAAEGDVDREEVEGEVRGSFLQTIISAVQERVGGITAEEAPDNPVVGQGGAPVSEINEDAFIVDWPSPTR